MAFIEKMENILNEDYNTSVTENGAVGYEHTKSALLDMNFKVPSYRKVSLDVVSSDFKQALLEDETLALKWAFYLRDVREGLGERRSFRAIIFYLGREYPAIMEKLFPLLVRQIRGQNTTCDVVRIVCEPRRRIDYEHLLVWKGISDF